MSEEVFKGGKGAEVAAIHGTREGPVIVSRNTIAMEASNERPYQDSTQRNTSMELCAPSLMP